MSTPIYISEKVMPYVYIGTHKETDQFYIGYRSANNKPSHQDLGTHYFTSSKRVKELGFENFNWIIFAEFFEGNDAYLFEQDLILENWNNSLKLNAHHDKSGKFSKLGTHLSEKEKKRVSEVHKGKKLSVEQLEDMSIRFKNVPKTEEHKMKISIAHKGKIKTEIHRSNISKSKLGIKLTEEHKKKISLATKGENNPMFGVQQERIQCPYCDKSGVKGNMYRWHYDNCKFKPF